ncbi:DUF2382 domain-containing protein [Leptolyngbya ohadii]|uniref:DUF2382 domain-containing protein n=1 Tax=Leptolyngbya ohadii TaxID=1962290 RepID=UPI000B59B19E|nr:DUF2382 domain-containing protein [Leptolyngbya ohadii]
MPLMKLEDFYPDHQDFSSEMGSDLNDIKKYDVYAQGDDKVGSVHDILVDDQTGEFRYFVVDTGFWIFGKKVLLPVGLATIDSASERIYANSLTRDQVESLPKFSDLEEIDYDYEESVRGVYRPSTSTTAMGTTGMAASGMTTDALATDVSAANPVATPAVTPDLTYDRDTYSYDRDAALYGMNERDHQTLKLYQERLIANKRRQKTGEVAVGKVVETETAHVAVPVEKERVVIERTTPGQVVTGDMSDAFQEDAVRMEVYEETPDIRKETILREEVTVRKEVDRDTVTADETLRREELDIDKDGNPIINNPNL